MHEFAYLSIGALRTKSGSTPSAASQYNLRDLCVDIILNRHAAAQNWFAMNEAQTDFQKMCQNGLAPA